MRTFYSGVICSNEDTFKSENGRLGREQYCNLSHRVSHSLSCSLSSRFSYHTIQSHSAFASDRNRIYDIFEKYLKLKNANYAYDSPARQVPHIHCFDL